MINYAKMNANVDARANLRSSHPKRNTRNKKKQTMKQDKISQKKKP